MASIYKRSNNWTVEVVYRVDGVRKKKRKSGFTTKSEAQKWANLTESKKYSGELSSTEKLFYPTMIQWYQIFKEPKIARATKLWFNTVLKLVEQEWPDKLVSDVRSSDFQQLLNKYGQTHVKVSTKRVNNIISEFGRYAFDEGYTTRDFTRNVYNTGKVESKTAEMKFLENDEFQKLIQRAKQSDSASAHMIITACLTGMRYAEIAGLRPENVDLKNKTISIVETWDQISHEFKPTKTKSSVRTISMPDDLVDLFKKWKIGDKFVFQGVNGYPATSASCNHTLKNYLEKDNSKKITFHGLRHTHASYLLANDISVQYVSERLGHANTNITLGIYAHLLEDKRNEENLKALDKLNVLNK